MKKLALLLLTFVSLSTAAFAADVAVSGKLTTWAGVEDNADDRNSDGSDSKGYLYVNGELNTSVELADNVKVVLQLELNDKVSNGNTLNAYNAAGRDTVEIDEAYVEVNEFFMDSLALKVGHMWMEYSLRANHRSMLIASDFTAFKGTFKFESGFLDVYYAKAVESLMKVSDSSDADIFGVHVEWNFNENIHVIGYLNNALFDNAGVGADHGNIITVGGGVDAFLFDKKLELFAELALQFGDESENVSHSGFAADLGARWTFPEMGSIKGLFVELNVGFRSGQDDDTDTTKFWNGWAARSGALIAEANYNLSSTNSDNPMYKGYADDSYLAIRLEAGAQWTEKIKSGLLIGLFTSTDEDQTRNGVVLSDEAYGVEVDLCTVYQHTENLSMGVHLGVFLPDDGLAVDGDTVFAFAFEDRKSVV